MNKQREHRRIWTPEEDTALRALVSQSPDPAKPKWKQISEQLNLELGMEFLRNPKQCRQRWFNSLAPASQQNKQWGIQDDVTLIRACKKYGHRWSRLTKQFNDSVNDNRLKNHFYSTVRKIVRVINGLVKDSKKQYQYNVKNDNLSVYSEQQLQVLKQISKLRTFQPKLLSKVFSLIDEKQQYRYEAKQSLQVQQLKSINNEILDYMEDYVTGSNEFTQDRILKLIVSIMQINRTIKTKYVREVKLSIQDEVEVQKEQENRKKREKKINSIVKGELENKIIPDRKTKNQIINKIRDENKKLNRLIRSTGATSGNKRRIKRLRSINVVQGENEEIREGIDEEDMDAIDENQQESPQSKSKTNKITSQQPEDKQKERQKYQQQNPNQQQQYDQVGAILNPYPSPYQDQNYMKNSNSYNYNFGNNSINIKNSNSNNNMGIGMGRLGSPSVNISTLFNFNQPAHTFPPINGNNVLSYSYDDYERKNVQGSGLMEDKNIPKSGQKDSGDKDEKGNFMANEASQKNQEVVKDNPFVSNFLNDIPLLTSNNSKKQKKQLLDAINPFFPEHKLTHSQGYFTFEQPQVQNPKRQEQELFKSNPNIGSINFIDFQSKDQKGEGDEKKSLKNSKVFQGLFASYNYSSINDKASQQSERMKSSLFDLIPNFHPMHTSAFCPILFGNAKDPLQNQPRERLLEISKPFSAHMVNENVGHRFNMEQSQPIVFDMYRSSDLHYDSNHSGASLYHSYSFGQMSQEGNSIRSKSKYKK